MGGNTLALLSCIKAAGFASKLKTVLNEVLIYGVSAGAIVFGHDIESAQIGPEADENTVGLAISMLSISSAATMCMRICIGSVTGVKELLQEVKPPLHSSERENGSFCR